MKSTNRRQTPEGERVTSARATIQLTVEVSIPDRWGGDCPLDQVFRQAASEALAKVSRLLGPAARVVGEPRVTAVLTEELRR